jgi:protein phosphatase
VAVIAAPALRLPHLCVPGCAASGLHGPGTRADNLSNLRGTTLLRAYGVTDKGRVRAVNEDCWAVDQARGLCVVADGMGGHQAGEVAARIAVETVCRFLASGPLHLAHWPFGYDRALSHAGNRLRTAIHLAHSQVLRAAVRSDRYAGMGTTIVAAAVDGNRLSVGHVGDSRLYILTEAGIRQLTHDDSWLASTLAANPAADPILLERHPMRHALTNVVGVSARTEVHVAELELHGGELLLLSTDGVHQELDDDRIERLMLDSSHLNEIAAGLVHAALARGSDDNCTAVVARYERD